MHHLALNRTWSHDRLLKQPGLTNSSVSCWIILRLSPIRLSRLIRSTPCVRLLSCCVIRGNLSPFGSMIAAPIRFAGSIWTGGVWFRSGSICSLMLRMPCRVRGRSFCPPRVTAGLSLLRFRMTDPVSLLVLRPGFLNLSTRRRPRAVAMAWGLLSVSGLLTRTAAVLN